MSAIARLKQRRITEEANAFGGSRQVVPFRRSGFDGAGFEDRETASWLPSMASPDQQINVIKPMADARVRDMGQNDGYASGGINIHKDSIVGAQYRLNAKPDWKALKAIDKHIAADETWAEEFQTYIEGIFTLLAESPSCWLDASRVNTFTSQVRLAVGTFVQTGEVLGQALYRRGAAYNSYGCRTAVRMISPDRLSNANGVEDSAYLRRGIEYDPNAFEEIIRYHIRKAMPTEVYDSDSYEWEMIPAENSNGRRQIIHIKEQRLPDQSRGISEVTSALKQMRMTKQFQEVTLQNAVINASYAASIESELPPDAVFSMMGGLQPGTKVGSADWIGQIGAYMTAMNAYMAGSQNIKLEGAMVPHLFPGTKLAMRPMGTPGGVGTGFEQSLLRYIAAAFGLSYEEFSRDFSQTNYSSARASMGQTGRHMASKKKLVADRFANDTYTLALEELIAGKNVPLPKGVNWNTVFGRYRVPLAKEALCRADWIGASMGQVDELKETQAALLRIKGGLSTYEKECAKLGSDFRDTFEQIAREQGIITSKKLILSNDVSSRTLMSDNTDEGLTDGGVKSAANDGSQEKSNNGN